MVQIALAKGKEPPDSDLPELTDPEFWVLLAFSELSTCRAVGFGPGPIPWYAIADYSDRTGFDMEWFLPIIRGLDKAFLEKAKKEMDRETGKGRS